MVIISKQGQEIEIDIHDLSNLLDKHPAFDEPLFLFSAASLLRVLSPGSVKRDKVLKNNELVCSDSN